MKTIKKYYFTNIKMEITKMSHNTMYGCGGREECSFKYFIHLFLREGKGGRKRGREI